MHNLIPTGRQCSAQAVRGDAAARRLAPISGAKTSTSLIEKMGDADTRNDHLSDADLPSQSALASLAEQPGDDAAKPRPTSRQAPEWLFFLADSLPLAQGTRFSEHACVCA